METVRFFSEKTMNNFDDIRPYNDAETVHALHKLSWNPLIWTVSKYLFPEESIFFLSRWARRIRSVEQFQMEIMNASVDAILDKSTSGLSISGIENISDIKTPMLLISNHRDIVLDPAFIQKALLHAGKTTSQLCVGDNLLGRPFVKDIMRSNKMIIVRRGISGREQLKASHQLSAYIREVVGGGVSSVWVAQKQGRAKNGIDKTSRGVLKMLTMSGAGNFVEDLNSLHIVPVSISYEYESCDYMKARELYLSRDGAEYKKRRGEDLRSILEGIKQQKGGVCIHFGKPITKEELTACTVGAKNFNVSFAALAELMDSRIREGYHLFDTNRYALDLLEGREAPAAFSEYVEARLDKAFAMQGKREERLDRDALRKIFLAIYANPVSTFQTGTPDQR